MVVVYWLLCGGTYATGMAGLCLPKATCCRLDGRSSCGLDLLELGTPQGKNMFRIKKVLFLLPIYIHHCNHVVISWGSELWWGDQRWTRNGGFHRSPGPDCIKAAKQPTATNHPVLSFFVTERWMLFRECFVQFSIQKVLGLNLKWRLKNDNVRGYSDINIHIVQCRIENFEKIDIQ